MKWVISFCLMLLVTVVFSVQVNTPTWATEADSVTIVSASTDFERLNYVTKDVEVSRRGCCSWHGGVCGCRNGRVLCCDGTLSPTCRCD
jgi:hypothetical protein